ncbi:MULTISPECIES: flagellar hook protein FlgE [Methylomonas]|uniref:Flagellar hook protein FlgE n=1 Tax=Methylomonas koyamae TaxID=702114 RepID=A0A291ING2_9GAMM|nr:MULTISPECIES: flagellar hook protein FlgE [Methylomonas]ANE56918.1 flagellar hook-basal body protein [Methylomonas sp. DH-1]ATG91872.1 flagellar hook-basal body protein [Methylomonas koyamae]OAI28864.1 flagellar hook-basal body protein [Methylomonas koyamae]WNB75312.1 flagellar hook protein FlgE [Methylomonas koyamae]BBL60092.1 flagellar hook protein FlgE [Methylomonas koyamae]
MPFTTALSGLNAASNNLAVTGNNIANANTVGFKKSRSEFADVYAASLGGVSSITPGAGVKVANVAQQFNQGNLQFTDNNLDLAISGEGFFTLAKSPTETNDLSYTRAGEFKLNKEGYLVNNQGKALLVYRPNTTKVEDGFSTGVTTPVQINTLTGLPSATDTVNMQLNLDAQDDFTPSTLPFDPTDSNTYNSQTSTTVYDTLGSPHILTTYFVKLDPATAPNPGTSEWLVYHYMSEPATPNTRTAVPVTSGTLGGTTPESAKLTFDSGGKLTDPVDGKFGLSSYVITPPTGAADVEIDTINFFGTTQVQQKFSVNGMTQNGLPAGRLTGIDIDDEGVIFARFSNGGSQTMGKVALTRFANNNGLAKLGDTSWGQSANSGEPIPGQAGANNFGAIQAGALESSNVDLSAQLVNLIVAQQHYQANAQTITTENSIMQTILQIR